MPDTSWIESLPAAVTVCDREGVILEMNEAACRAFAKDGGAALIGRNVLDCHPAPARAKLAALLAAGETNCYTIEKNGARKLIYQAPWYKDGACAGLVEIAIPLPAEIPNYVR